MNIFSIFTAKKNASSLFSVENIENFLNFAQSSIKSAQRFKNLSGEEKKRKVDDACAAWIEENFKTNNAFLAWAVETILVPAIPTVTQCIYNFIKSNVQGITRKK